MCEFLWNRNKKELKYEREIDLKELKVLQMDILSAIDEYCSINNIKYSLACGTLLGAIRHKGYIPWDDDIDIYIPRDDYKRLVSSFPESYKERYKIISLERDLLWDRPYAKAYNAETHLEESSIEKKRIGVNIDIFPVDDVPIGAEWTKYDRKRRFEQKLFLLKFVKLDLHRDVFKNIILIIFRIITSLISTRSWAERIDRKCQQFNGRGYRHYFECCQGILQKKPFPKELFDEIIDVLFEDRFFKCFADADCYLKNGFGNYMQLPPEEKRVTHHSFKAYWK